MDIIKENKLQSTFVSSGILAHIEKMTNNCRLGVLNFDCLEKIFERLSTEELISLSNLNPVVCGAIKERVLKKRMINCNDWNRVWNTETFFETFGEWIKIMTIGEKNIDSKMCKESTAFNYFLQLFVKHCTENRITFLSLSFDIDQVDRNLLNAAKPFFTKLQELHYTSIGGKSNSEHESLLEAVIDGSDNLKTIQLNNTWGKGNWLRTSKMKNVQTMALMNSSVLDEENQNIYFNQGPKLKTFSWINSSLPNQKLCENVVRNCPDLKCFIDIQHEVPVEYLSENFSLNRYNYFANVKQLRCARVTAYTRSGQDLIYLFSTLAQNNSVQNLSVNFLINAIGTFNHQATTVGNRWTLYDRYPHFTSLKCLDIQNFSTCMYWGILIQNFLLDLKNLQELSISGSEIINPVQMSQMVLAPPNLKILKIFDAPTDYLYMVVDAIGKILQNERKMTIFMNSEQYADLRKFKINEKIKIIVV